MAQEFPNPEKMKQINFDMKNTHGSKYEEEVWAYKIILKATMNEYRKDPIMALSLIFTDPNIQNNEEKRMMYIAATVDVQQEQNKLQNI